MKLEIGPAHVLSNVKTGVDRAVTTVCDVASRAPLAYDGLRLKRFAHWGPELDAALDACAPAWGFDAQVHRIAAADVAGVTKRHAIVSDGDETIAVLSLRRRGMCWEPVTEGCLPVAEVVARPGRTAEVIRATRLNVCIEDLDEVQIDALAPDVRSCHRAHRAPLDDYEALWRDTGNWKNVRNARNKTKDIAVVADRRDDIAGLVDLWADAWADSVLGRTAAAADMRAVWEHCFEQGDVHVVGLHDDGVLAGGVVNFHAGDVAFGLCLGRDRHHPNKGLGSRILDESFNNAASNGAAVLDMATGLDYKTKWANMTEDRHTAEFFPRVERWYRWSRSMAARAVRRGAFDEH